MAGALCAWYLSEQGLDTVVVEKFAVGRGSTAANTGLLQFANDMPLHRMVIQHGHQEGVRFYRMCLEAVKKLEQLCSTLPDDAEFRRRDSLYYASCAADVYQVADEYELLKNHAFPVTYLSRDDIRERFSFTKEAAIYSTGDAEVNPFRLTHALFKDGTRKNIRVFENTEVSTFEFSGEKPHFRTTQGHEIRAKAAVLAMGYQATEHESVPSAKVHCTYAIATDAVSSFSGWQNRCLIWETARPYLYMRTTPDDASSLRQRRQRA